MSIQSIKAHMHCDVCGETWAVSIDAAYETTYGKSIADEVDDTIASYNPLHGGLLENGEHCCEACAISRIGYLSRRGVLDGLDHLPKEEADRRFQNAEREWRYDRRKEELCDSPDRNLTRLP